MGAASCKNSKSPPQNQQKVETKNITIGVFGLDDAGKTSTVKAIEGAPTDNVTPTVSSLTTMVTHPFTEKNDRKDKNKNEQRVKIIDVSGAKKFRHNSWAQFYDQIHGLIFVIDSSEQDRLDENKETLEDLLDNEKLKNKPILILANKQDQRGAIKTEFDLKRKLKIDTLKAKYKIELCTAVPRNQKSKADESIRNGFSWLIRTIDDNYTQINSRVMKAKTAPNSRKTYRSESDDSDNKYAKGKNTSYPTKNSDNRSRITSEKLPSITKNNTKLYSDDDDDDVYVRNNTSPTNGINKKKKVLGGVGYNDTSTKKSNTNDPKAFRSTYEPFPEETPWTSSSGFKSTRNDDMFPKLNTKSSIIGDTKRRDISPLVRDTKSYSTNSLSKRNVGSDNEDDYTRQQKAKTTSRFDSAPSSTNKFPSNTKKTTSGIHGDDDDYYNNTTNRRTNSASKKPYSRYDDNDDDEDNYLRKSSQAKTNKNYGSDDDKSYQRSSDRGTLSKPASRSKFDDDDDDYPSTSKPATRSTYNNTKSTTRSKHSDDDDDRNRWSSTKGTTRSKFDDDDYPSSSTKATTRPKYDDDDDDYLNSSKKNSYYGSSGSQSRRVENDDFFTSKGGSNTANRFKKATEYDS